MKAAAQRQLTERVSPLFTQIPAVDGWRDSLYYRLRVQDNRNRPAHDRRQDPFLKA
jgi:hypothetical protein